MTYRQHRLDTDRPYIRAALERHGWRLRAAAQELGLSDQGLRAIVRRVGLWEEYQARHGGVGQPRRRA